MPGDDPGPLDVVAREVEGDVAETVNVEHRRVDPLVREARLGEIESDERVGVERRPELLQRHAVREVRRRRGEEVAAVERPRDALERIGRVGELSHVGDPRALGGGKQKPVVRADEEPALAIREHDGASDPPTPGSTTARWTPGGMYGSVLERTSAPWSTCVGGMPCVTSITRASGAIRAITP